MYTNNFNSHQSAHQQQQPYQVASQQQQQSYLQTQPTAYSAPLHPQFTAYAQQPLTHQQQLHHQPTLPNSQPQFHQYSAQPQLHSLSQYSQPLTSKFQTQIPQQNGQSQTNPSNLAPQPTGMTSAQMADSFRASSSQPTPSLPTRAGSSKIPSIRLSFITASDQAKFEQLFKSAVGTGQAMTGVQARELLLRSKLTGDALARIWTLADTTKSGQLLFPEFALAMYLCNLSLNGKDVPTFLPDRVKNEVSSMVDIISFGIPDEKPLPPISQANAPNYPDSRDFNSSPAAIHQPQPQQSNTQLLASLHGHPTGMAPQMTGYAGQMIGMPSQQTGIPTQQSGHPSMSLGANYNGSRPPMPPLPTGFGPAPSAPLNAQPTGLPGQWGLVNTPTTGLPNIDALHRQMMPQSGSKSGYTTAGLSGNATIPWAVTKDEKKIYDDIFKAWDGFGKGYVSGDQAIEIFGQSGLNKPDLERIWTLSDPNNKGRLNLDEFAVAMHLIYRKLNDYPVPNQLPPELTPPSTRNLNDSIGAVKSMLSRDAEQRKVTGAFLQPQRTGVSYLKSHSFRQGSPLSNAADGTIFKNNDDHVGYRSSARRRAGGDGRSFSPAISGSDDEPSADQLRKLIHEKGIVLDAIDFRDENQAEDDQALDRRDKRDVEELFRRIRLLQEQIDSNRSESYSYQGDSTTERRQLGRQLQTLNDRLPDLASQVRRCERAIADAQLELFRFNDAKTYPGASPIVGTGLNGTITESDRVRARAKALMQQRSAALTGKPMSSSTDDPAAATQRLDAECSRIREERERNERMVRDVEESVSTFGKALEDSLKEGAPNPGTEHERRRWHDALGVEEEVRDFIYELQRQSEEFKTRVQSQTMGAPPKPHMDDQLGRSANESTRSGISGSGPSPISKSSLSEGGSYSSYRTAEERTAYIKQQAEQRMAERLAALGIKPTKLGETAQQRAERDRREQEARLRKAEEEDAQREQERQRRLADERITPPSVNKPTKKPPPPPTRKSAGSSQSQAIDESSKAEQDLKRDHEVQEMKTRRLADEEQSQEKQLAQEREAQDARLRALEEQVRQGKLRKEEEKKKRQMEHKATKEREAKLAAHKAELEAARERERRLQLQLESLGDESSSDDDGPQQITPPGTNSVASQELPQLHDYAATSNPPTPTLTQPSIASTSPSQRVGSAIAVVPSPSANEVGTKNPFLKKMQAANVALPQAPPVPLVSGSTESMNPFHKLAAQQEAKVSSGDTPLSGGRARQARVRDDDDWSVVEEDSSDEDDSPIGGGAKQLASLLFGTMAPPRPLSSMDNKNSTSASLQDPASISSPPLSPPLPGNAPPPPPLPSAGSAPTTKRDGGAPDIGSLLGAIKQGTGLRKVETKDRSASSVAGRVLN